ncbi:hypothetical protein HK098_005960 [Nowakowskiella sp. JEL0407]|nr:hypothetical protein HK098_005960 [Nowakowskiella sp. JEL0407]
MLIISSRPVKEMFQCTICSAVLRNEQGLASHSTQAHGRGFIQLETVRDLFNISSGSSSNSSPIHPQPIDADSFSDLEPVDASSSTPVIDLTSEDEFNFEEESDQESDLDSDFDAISNNMEADDTEPFLENDEREVNGRLGHPNGSGFDIVARLIFNDAEGELNESIEEENNRGDIDPVLVIQDIEVNPNENGHAGHQRMRLMPPTIRTTFPTKNDFLIAKHVMDYDCTVLETAQLIKLLKTIDPSIQITLHSYKSIMNAVYRISDTVANFNKHKVSVSVSDSSRHRKTITQIYYCRDILECVNQLWTNKSHRKVLQKEFSERVGDESCEMWHCECFSIKDIIRSANGFNSPVGVICALMIYSDSTVLTQVGRMDCHPIYLYLGNHPIDYRNRMQNDAVTVVGYLPKLPSDRDMGISKAVHSNLKRTMLMKVISSLLSPLISVGKTGIELKDVNTPSDFDIVHPVIAQIVTDHMEAIYYTGTRAVSALYPCSYCTVHRDDLSNLSDALDGHFLARDVESTKNAYQAAQRLSVGKREQLLKALGLANVSIPIIKNILWELPLCNVFSCVALDPLHQLDIGIWGHMMEFLRAMIQEHSENPAAAFAEIVSRCAQIPRFTGLHVYEEGTMRDAKLTGSEYRNLQKIFLPVIQGLFGYVGDLDNDVTTAFQYFIEFRTLVDMYYHTEEELERMKILIYNIETSFKKTFLEYSKSSLNFIKFHTLSHYVEQIRRFGPPRGTTTQLGEFAHQYFAKRPWKKTNKRDHEIKNQMARYVERQIKMRLLTQMLRESGHVEADPEELRITRFFNLPVIRASPKDSGCIGADMLIQKITPLNSKIQKLPRVYSKSDYFTQTRIALEQIYQ